MESKVLILGQKLFRGKDGELSVFGRLAAGACAGMTSTFVSISSRCLYNSLEFSGIMSLLISQPYTFIEVLYFLGAILCKSISLCTLVFYSFKFYE